MPTKPTTRRRSHTTPKPPSSAIKTAPFPPLLAQSSQPYPTLATRLQESRTIIIGLPTSSQKVAPLPQSLPTTRPASTRISEHKVLLETSKQANEVQTQGLSRQTKVGGDGHAEMDDGRGVVEVFLLGSRSRTRGLI